MQVEVSLPHHQYPIYIHNGILDQVAETVSKHRFAEQLFIITDTHVQELYGRAVLKRLRAAGFACESLAVPAGEASKSLDQCQQLFTWLIEKGANRKAGIIALGGGVVGDLAGFVAASFMRGVRFIQIPTTVLAQVDSSVGGKVGVNHPQGKNLIGAFYHPECVLIDPLVLTTLPQREVRAGLAEIVKYGFIREAALLEAVAENWQALLQLEDMSAWRPILAACCRIKAEVVQNDERENGLRAILNFGHTVGHALESATKYAYFLHGEAVAHGMIAALDLSRRLGHLSAENFATGLAHIERLQAPAIPAHISVDALLAGMSRDKKRTAAGQLWVLISQPGEAVLKHEVPAHAVEASMQVMLQRGR